MTHLHVGLIIHIKYPIYRNGTEFYPPIELAPAGANVHLSRHFEDTDTFMVRWLFTYQDHRDPFTFVATRRMILEALGEEQEEKKERSR